MRTYILVLICIIIEVTPGHSDIEMTIINAVIETKKLLRGKKEYLLHVTCELKNKSARMIYTNKLGLSKNFIKVITPDGMPYSYTMKVKLKSPLIISMRETKIFEDLLVLNNEDESWIYREVGIYKFYWVFHNEVLTKPIEVEKLADGSFKILKY